MFDFEIIASSKKSKARVGKIRTQHGDILTPAFIPVATLGVVKGALDTADLNAAGVQCKIVNTFHFLDLDRVRTVRRAGGLHEFTNFKKPIFTDSGGFQIFSLGKGAKFGLGKIGSVFPGESTTLTARRHGLLKKITENGVRFSSPRDGRPLLLTPEISARIQRELGADFIYPLDICGSVTDGHETTCADLERTNRWYERFLAKTPQCQRVFGIVQGGRFKNLRHSSTDFVNKLPVFGIAIGGALGKSRKEMFKIISWVNERIDWSRPHHLLGIGDIESIEEIIKLGIDLFDCALPTRIARHGTALTSHGTLNLTGGKLANAFRPIDESCACPTCGRYSVAQLNFLFRSKEPLGGRLLTIHNLHFIEQLLRTIRNKIRQNSI